MKVFKEKFGEISGNDVYLFRLVSERMEAEIIEYGATLRSLRVCGADGVFRQTVLSFETLEDYRKNPFFLNAICGRNANRIEDARIELDGEIYELQKNDGANNLHSGTDGFHTRLFHGECMEDGVIFSLFSPALDQGFPGNVMFHVSYTFTKENGLLLSYRAVSDEDTIMNPTSHAYFNLEGGGTILDHKVTLACDYYTPNKENTLVNGEIVKVTGTPFDFTKSRRIGDVIDGHIAPVENGYDNNFVITGDASDPVATVVAPKSGITMEVYTDLPGIQFYTGNFLSGYVFPGTEEGGLYSGLCLETQYFPNSLRYPHYAQPILAAGEVFLSETEYRFIVS